MRIRILALVVFTVVMVVPHVAWAAKPAATCPHPFDLGLVTLEEDLRLPRTRAGLAAGEFTVQEIEEFHAIVDRAGDGLCFQTIPASGKEPGERSPWRFNYNVVDNNASSPTA